MCMLYACHSGYPNERELEAAARRNSDGAGVAWVDRDKKVVRFEKGLGVDEVKDLIRKLPFPFLVHFRAGSMHSDDPRLNHPFPLTPNVSLDLKGEAPAVLAHNGFLHDWQHVLKTLALQSSAQTPLSPWSDTRVLAWAVKLKGKGVIPVLIGSLLSNSSGNDRVDRVAILEATPKPMIHFWGQWIEPDGKDPGYWQSTRLGPESYRMEERRGGSRGGARKEEEEGPERAALTPPNTRLLPGNVSRPPRVEVITRPIPSSRLGVARTFDAATPQSSPNVYSAEEIAASLDALSSVA